MATCSITRNICGREVTFDVYDSVNGFTESRWKRIVAVFVHGHDSQFKDWGNNGLDKKKLFARVRGYSLSFLGVKPNAGSMLGAWNLFRLQIPRYKRHLDAQAQTRFWLDLEQFLKREKFTDCDF